jgi:pimeloyl-ACP methyl ester carboxylesterase
VAEVSDQLGEIDGIPVFWHEAPAPAAATSARAAAPLYLHGVPTNSDDWLPFLDRTGGLAPDLPGFGRSGKPGFLRYTIDEYEGFLERFLDDRGVERVSIVMHDWGTVGLAFAQLRPQRIERLVVINAVPFLPGYRWHRIARAWRAPLVGELVMGTTTRRTARFAAKATGEPLPEEIVDRWLDHFDQGTQRAILRLYRSSPPEVLAAAGLELAGLDKPTLVIWGMADPYIPARFARDYADALGARELLELPDAGHWPWLDRPDILDTVARFLGAKPE